MLYVLNKDPLLLSRTRISKGGKVYSESSGLKLCSEIELKSQHGDSDILVKGPLELSTIFFFNKPQKGSNCQKRYHDLSPNLLNLMKVILSLMEGIVFDNESIISKIDSQKRYCVKPRVEIEIKRIEE